MATLGQLYSSGDSGLTVKKTHMVPLSSLYIEEGFNIRDIDWEHVHSLKDAWKAGETLPPLFVEVMADKRVKVIDGHHRFLAALEATKEGCEIPRIECKDFVGSEADKVAFMITSSQGRSLAPTERAMAYYRLYNQGFSVEEIAKKVKRSTSDVREHLKLAECEPELKELVKSKSLTYSDALVLQKEYGANAVIIAKDAVQEAQAQGKTRAAFKKFNHKKAYTTLSSEVNNIIDFLDKQQSNTDIVNPDETLKLVFEKLQQTMEIVRDSGWR